MADAGTIRKNMIWNVCGSLCFVGAQWCMTILIVHLSGFEASGWLSLGLSLTNVATNIVYFGIRNFQVSDTKEKYPAETYVKQRMIMAVFAMAAYIVFVAVNKYPFNMGIFLILFMIYRITEPLADVFHGIDQQHWRLDIAGRSYVLRGLSGLAVFIAALYITKNLIITTCVMILAVYPVLFFYDIPSAYSLKKFEIFPIRKKDIPSIKALSGECLPLFVYVLSLNATVPVPRYFLERSAGSEVLGFYSSVAIPASIIQMFSSYVFTTFTGLFSEYAKEGNIKAFKTLMIKLYIVIAFIALVAAIMCKIPIGIIAGKDISLGDFALRLLFTEKIAPYTYLLVPAILSCGIIALVWFGGMLLTVLRDRKGLITGAVAGAAISVIASGILVNSLGPDGVNMTIAISSGITLVIFVIRVHRALVNINKNRE